MTDTKLHPQAHSSRPTAWRRAAIAATALAACLAPGLAAAQQKSVKIAILNDMSSVYSDYQGEGSVIAAKLAAEDFGNRLGVPIEIVSADHQNKPDIGAAITRRWFDTEGVDVVMDVPNSSVAFAVANLAREKNKVFIGSGAGSSDLTGPACSPNTVHWTYDTWELGHGIGKFLTEQGNKSWFFVSADYAFGKDLQKNAVAAVEQAGGKVVGSVNAPLGGSDFSSFILQAQSSGAQVVAFANAGGDLSTSLKQSAEFGLAPKQKLVGFVVTINNVLGLGLQNMQGLTAIQPFYWDMNDGTRAFAKRFQERHSKHYKPNDMQAGMYSATLHYLKAVEKLKSAADGKAVVDAMKAMPSDDPLFGKGSIRVDGRHIHPIYLYAMKTPAESTGDWDWFKQVGTIPAEEAFRPLDQGGCPLVTAK